MSAPVVEGGGQKFKSILSLVIKRKIVQNVTRMLENIISVCQIVSISIRHYVRMQLFSLGIKMKVVPNVISRKLWESENLYGQQKSPLLFWLLEPASVIGWQIFSWPPIGQNSLSPHNQIWEQLTDSGPNLGLGFTLAGVPMSVYLDCLESHFLGGLFREKTI